MDKLLTSHELAELLSLPEETVKRYTREKKIPVVEFGDHQYAMQKKRC